MLSNKLVIFLMGPTASGKTNFAIEIAKKYSVRIISVDSAMIYKGMDIGTAKPDKRTLVKFPHYLVDIVAPNEIYSASSFISDATEQINLAFENDQIPILVGGTSFYFKALENGLSSLPESTQETKSKYKKIIEENSSEYLHKKLMEIDPVSAERIHQNDSQRIIRAMEVYELSGSPMSELQGQKIGGINHPIKKIVLMPERSILHERIENRFIDMIKEGFIEEVKEIIKEYNLSADSPSMRCVGYRQVLNFLEGKNSNSEMIENSIYASRQLCKRQCTWLNAEEDALFLKDANIKEFSNLIKPFL
jgi:tRNA dimethylallyltransferase